MSDDPLDGADIGDTERVDHTVTYYAADAAPSDWFASDRIVGDLDIEDVEIVENQYGEPGIQVRIATDVTKRLPRQWDHHAEPVTDAEKRRARRRTWLRRAGKAASLGIPTAVCFWVAIELTRMIGESITVNGQPLDGPSGGSVAVMVLILTGLMSIIHYGLKGGLPRRMGGAR